jgi:hypothetical protein
MVVKVPQGGVLLSHFGVGLQCDDDRHLGSYNDGR